MSDSSDSEIYRRRPGNHIKTRVTAHTSRKPGVNEPRRRMSSNIHNRISELSKKTTNGQENSPTTDSTTKIPTVAERISVIKGTQSKTSVGGDQHESSSSDRRINTVKGGNRSATVTCRNSTTSISCRISNTTPVSNENAPVTITSSKKSNLQAPGTSTQINTKGSEGDNTNKRFERGLRDLKENKNYLSGPKNSITDSISSPHSSSDNVSKVNSIKNRIRNLNRTDLTEGTINLSGSNRPSIRVIKQREELKSSSGSDLKSKDNANKDHSNLVNKTRHTSRRAPNEEKSHTIQNSLESAFKSSTQSPRSSSVIPASEIKANKSEKTSKSQANKIIKEDVNKPENNNNSIKTAVVDFNKGGLNQNVANDEEKRPKMSSSMNRNHLQSTGVKSYESKLHTEQTVQRQGGTPPAKVRGEFFFTVENGDPSVGENVSARLSAKFNKIQDGVLENNERNRSSTFGSTGSEGIPEIIKKTSERLQSKATLGSTWTSNESNTESDAGTSSDNGLVDFEIDSDSSVASAAEEKEQSRRRRLVKRAKKRRRGKRVITAKKSSRLDGSSPSDGDPLESTDPEFSRSRASSIDTTTHGDTDFLSDGDTLNEDDINIRPYPSTDTQTTISTSSEPTPLPVTEHKNITEQSHSLDVSKSNIDVESFVKEVEVEQQIDDDLKRELELLDDLESDMKSASMTNVYVINKKPKAPTKTFTNNVSHSNSIITKESRLATLNALKNGPFGSFTNVAKISKFRLESFKTKPPSAGLKSRTMSDTDEPLGDDNAIIASPFSIRKFRGQTDSGRFSDGEHEITSRLAKLDEDFDKGGLDRTKSLPRTARYREGFDTFAKGPFHLNVNQCRTDDSDDPLKHLPDSPFSLIGRFTQDTQKMLLSRSTGSLGKKFSSPSLELEQSLSLSAEANEMITDNEIPVKSYSGDNSDSTLTPSVHETPNTILSAMDDLINNNLELVSKEVDIDIYENFDVPVIAPPDNFRDETELCQSSSSDKEKSVRKQPKTDSSKVLTRPSPPPLTLSMPQTECADITKVKACSKAEPTLGKIRRPSYMMAHDVDDELRDPMSIFKYKKELSQTSAVDGQESADTDSAMGKRPLKRARPKLPGTLTCNGAEESKLYCCSLLCSFLQNKDILQGSKVTLVIKGNKRGA